MSDPFAVLTALGKQGYAVSLSFGGIYGPVAWACIIGARTIGSITIGLIDATTVGYHETDPIEAARRALTSFYETHPEVKF